MPTIELTKIQTMSQKSFIAPTRHFTASDALALEVFVKASAELVALPRVMFQVVFSIIDAPSNRAVFTRAVLSPFLHGPEFWMLLGNTLAGGRPLTTPFRYGLLTNWAAPFSGQGVLGFRAVVQTFQITTSGGTEVLTGLEPFDVSPVCWFHLAGPSVTVDNLIGTGIWPGEAGRSATDADYPGDLPLSQGRLRG